MTRKAGSAGIFAMSIALMVSCTDAVTVVPLSAYVCDSKIYNLQHYQLWSIEWTGQKLPKTCRLGVRAEVVSVTICFSIKRYRLDSCGFFLGIYSSYSNTPKKIYSCGALRRKVRFCIHGYKLLYLQITSNYTKSASFSPEVRISVMVAGGDKTGKHPDGSSVADILAVIFGSIFFFVITTCPVVIRIGCASCCDFLCSICKRISHCLDCLSCDNDEQKPRRQYTETVVTNETPGVYTVTNRSRAVSLGSLESLEESNSMLLCDNERDPPAYIPSSSVENDWDSSVSLPLSNVDNERDSDVAPPPPCAPSAASLPDVPPPSYYDCKMTTKKQLSVS